MMLFLLHSDNFRWFTKIITMIFLPPVPVLFLMAL